MADENKGRARQAAQERADERRALAGTLLPAHAAELDQAARGTLAKADVLDELFDTFKPMLEKQLPDMIDPDSFIRTVLTGLRTSRQAVQLMRSSRPSLLTALMEAARLGLTPFTDEGAIVPFWSSQEHQYTATFIPMWKGYKELFFRTGQVSGLAANLIYQQDDWDLTYGDDGHFWHRPNLVDRETGETIPRGVEGNIAIMSYCYLTFRDGTRTEVTTITRGQAIEIRDNYSKAYAEAEERWRKSNGAYGKDSFWHTDFDKAMRKSAVRAHTSVAPMSTADLRLLVAIDRRDDRRPEVAAQAAPIPQMPPADNGIDWTKDVGGAIPGQVDGEGQQREQATVTRPGGPVPPPKPDGGATATARTRNRLRGRFSRAELAGDDDVAVRLVITGYLVAGQYRELADDAALTEAEARYAIDQFDALQSAADKRGEDLREVLMGVHARAVAERDGGQQDGGGDLAGAGPDVIRGWFAEAGRGDPANLDLMLAVTGLLVLGSGGELTALEELDAGQLRQAAAQLDAGFTAAREAGEEPAAWLDRMYAQAQRERAADDDTGDGQDDGDGDTAGE